MKVIVCVVVLCLSFIFEASCSERGDSLVVVFWNVENFFDYYDGETGDSDREFSSMGARHWTKKKFYAKCDAVAKTVFWLADRYGRMPDVIGLAEVENRGVLTRMLSSTLMRKYDYGIVHRESGDRRGIDVALLYRKSVMDTLSTSFVTPIYEGNPMQTRDILHARMSLADGSVADFIVNHHPSKFGGEEESRGRRDAAMETLKHFCDSLKGDQMIVMGDFNDTPDAEQFRMLDGLLVNKAEGLHQRREGTIRYEGKWELIDMFMTSPSLAAESRMEIVRVPFLMTYEKKHPGEKPLRTYVGPRYTGGVSDHCPIVLRVYFQ
jgi:endonuclease/exonuclease/phosphatase family metal-dependent hydrolase